jgi:hypothetical protein
MFSGDFKIGNHNSVVVHSWLVDRFGVQDLSVGGNDDVKGCESDTRPCFECILYFSDFVFIFVLTSGSFCKRLFSIIGISALPLPLRMRGCS